MASSSGGGDVPVNKAPTAAAVNDVVQARRGVETLKSFLLQLGDRRSPWAERVADDVLNRLSDATSKLLDAGAASGGQSPAAAPSSGRARPQRSGSSNGNTRKRSFSRRSQRASSQSRIVTTLDDGHIWRKYGQKDIQNSPHPRSYFRCTHKTDQGCNARRYVQVCETDPSKHVVTYYGEHTCRDPSTNPIVIHAAGAGNLISFAPASRTTGVAASSSQQMATDGSATHLSTSWCTSHDVFSSSPAGSSFMQVVGELGAVVVGSAAAVMSPARTLPATSAPENGGMTLTRTGGGGTAGAGSFPSSPNSLGFEVGDDDFFRLDLDDP